MGMALEGIQVLDWSQWQQGPIASMLLGDLGADVIKIEERTGGDPARGAIRVGGNFVAKNLMQRNPYFEIGNRNKRSIALDLKKESARRIVYRLVERADVFVHNFRPSAAERLGVDYETLVKHNPRLIYAQSSGWGAKGPDKDAPSFDPAAMARSGFWSLLTEPGREPNYPQGGIADAMGGIMTAFGVLAALVHRDHTGEGQKLDASILGGMAYLVGYPLTIYTMAGFPPRFIPRKNPWNPLYTQYRCGDDRWLALVLIPPDKYWARLCRAIGLQHLEKDPRFDSLDNRQKNAAELIAILDESFAAKPSDEWLKILKANDLPAWRISTIEEFASDPQTLANEYVTEYDHPVWGKIRTMGFPVNLSRTPCSIRREAPELGQHTEEVLTELLGYTWDDIARLKDEQAI
ncbi:MAG: CoA transferase [Chloroflexi bacterium]|nr:CoA transferase [Chloroflexota bacterium]